MSDAFEMMRGFGVDEKVIREFMKEPLKGKLWKLIINFIVK